MRLPNPPAEYDQKVQNEINRTLESVLRQLLESTADLPDPKKSLNGLRITAETDTEVTFEWTNGHLVDSVWIYDFTAEAPLTSDRWAAIPAEPDTVLADVMSYTTTKPKQGQIRLIQFEPRLIDLTVGLTRRWELTPKQSTMAGSIKAAVTNDTADLTVVIIGDEDDWPVTAEVFEGAPDSAPIISQELNASGSFTKLTAGWAALGARALPLRELQRWWVRLTNRANIVTWLGPTAADRDALPGGAVTALDDQIRCEYDDDTDAIRITLPNGAYKEWTGLSGGGTKTYTVGDAVTSGSIEADLGNNEIRDGYLVEYTGGGTTAVFYRGALYGPIVAKLPSVLFNAVVSNTTADLTITVSGPASAWPQTLRVYEASPTSAPILTVAGISGSTSYNKLSHAVLGSRSLPNKEAQRWWATLTDADGDILYFGPAVADRDAMPGGAVGDTAGALKISYDDDTTLVKVTVPGGRVKTWSVFGGGFETYTPGSTALDDTTFETALAQDEVRDGYVVEVYGGGSWLEIFRGAIWGSNQDYTIPKIDVSTSDSGGTVTFTYSVTGSYTSLTKRIDSTNSALGSASGSFPVAKGNEVQVVQIIAVGTNGQTISWTGTVPSANIRLAGLSAWKDQPSVGNMQIFFAVTAAPAGATYKCFYDIVGGDLDTQSGVSNGSSWPISSFGTGDAKVTVQAYDSSGNAIGAPISVWGALSV